jgi:hypothetical protein
VLGRGAGTAVSSDTLFSDDATALIHQISRGYPRAVNNLALQALLANFAASKAIVNESSAKLPSGDQPSPAGEYRPPGWQRCLHAITQTSRHVLRHRGLNRRS